VATVVAAIACLVALVRRYRRSRGDERQQMKWFAYGGVLFVVLLPANTALADGRPVLGVLALVAVPILPVSIAVGVLKYRLYDIDIVIRRTVVFALLAAFHHGRLRPGRRWDRRPSRPAERDPRLRGGNRRGRRVPACPATARGGWRTDSSTGSARLHTRS
jgi:hypothetical protein